MPLALMGRAAAGAVILTFAAACQVDPQSASQAPADSTAATPFVMASDSIAAGRYLVIVGGCNDCHTPGFMQDPAAVSETACLTGVPIGFRGPWGTTYPSNLRVVAAGLDADEWVTMLHTRTALPPMPWYNVNHISEQDARAMYHYIRSLRPLGEPAPTAVGAGAEPTTPYIDFQVQAMERLIPGPPPVPAAPGEPADSARGDTASVAPPPQAR